MNTDKIVAELMALHRAVVQAAIDLDVADSFGSGLTKEQIDEMRADVAAKGAALEQAIRRAVDWGEPVAHLYHDKFAGMGDGALKISQIDPPDIRSFPVYARRQDQ